MFAHPVEDRSITMREAARLQTFPDTFRFVSNNIRDLSAMIGSVSAMIGSAVPPLLAKKIAWSIARYLDELQFFDLSPQDRETVKPQATDAVLKRLQHQEWGNGSKHLEQFGLFAEDEDLTT